MRLLALISLLAFLMESECISSKADSTGEWITLPGMDHKKPNQWLGFSKTFELSGVPDSILLQLAADTKYWVWLNGELVLREGGLKWGPDSSGYYYDELILHNGLKEGENMLEIAIWYFGKDGFAHKNSGSASLKVESEFKQVRSDTTWKVSEINCFSRTSEGPQPNWRLAESNIRFVANKAGSSEKPYFGCENLDFSKVVVLDQRGNIGLKRPIPQWKDYGLKNYETAVNFPWKSDGDTLIMTLPHNMHVTPYFMINASAGQAVDIRMDNYRGGSEYNVRTIYVTSQGEQSFETPGWMNGHEVRYYFPPAVEVIKVAYRETGYNSEFDGAFQCDDEFYNELWKKSARTLYVTMRDNFMDCPDRERAQWWGDAVLQLGQCPYVFDRSSDLLIKKAIYELMNWQKADGTIFSPVPAGNWDKELPTQMLASVGFYGLWTYYMNTGDKETLRAIYPKVKSYLEVWNVGDNGLVVERQGGWTWGDWGAHKDMPLIFNGWYYLALKGQMLMASELGFANEAKELERSMNRLAASFNKEFWNGEAYRSAAYGGETDERGQALAVVSGIADSTKYGALSTAILQGEQCSPYFEKYVYEALVKMGHADKALIRMKKRYASMVASPITTLWEGWEVGSSTWGGGTYNHSWSGGALTILSREIAGVRPLEPGFKKVLIKPSLGDLRNLETTMTTSLGMLKVNVTELDGKAFVEYDAPEGMEVVVE